MATTLTIGAYVKYIGAPICFTPPQPNVTLRNVTVTTSHHAAYTSPHIVVEETVPVSTLMTTSSDATFSEGSTIAGSIISFHLNQFYLGIVMGVSGDAVQVKFYIPYSPAHSC